jgi:methyl-accepting chemotaxis protein
MTVEERVEFLTQSIESHDRQLGELVERMDRLTVSVDKTTSNIDALGMRVDRLAETTQLNFDRLTAAMMGLTEHVANHQRRIEDLER